MKFSKKLSPYQIAHETLKTFSLTHNYNIWIINLLAPYIGNKILEVGCGIGNLTFYLQNFGNLSCIDISEYYLAHMKIDFPNIKFYKFDIADENVKVLKNHNFDTVVCVNVLEHIADDRKALHNIFELLQPGGRLLLFVPALQFLYGSVDQKLSHFRRYDKKPLKKLLNDTAFEVERIFYSNFIAMFGWFFNSKVQRKKELSYWQTILFDKFVPFIAYFEQYIKPPCGMSLMAVAKKPMLQKKT